MATPRAIVLTALAMLPLAANSRCCRWRRIRGCAALP